MKLKMLIATLALIGSSCVVASELNLEEVNYSDFEQYVLAISWQPSFCQYKYESLLTNPDDSLPRECNPQGKQENNSNYLTVHGLWPSLPKSIEVLIKSTDNKHDRWNKEGCAVLGDPFKYFSPKKKCDAPELKLSQDILNSLQSYMPGANVDSCLERYEYAKHGVCFGYKHDQYFNAMIELVGQFRKSKVGEFMSSRYGKSFGVAEFSDVVSDAFGEMAPSAFEVVCTKHGERSYLDEIRVTLKKNNFAEGLTFNSKAFLGVVGVVKKQKCEDSIFLDPRGFKNTSE